MLVSAVALVTSAPSAAYAQCSLGNTPAVSTINTAFIPSVPAFLSSEPNSGPDQQSGGAWARALGGTVTEQFATNFNASFTVTPPGGHSFRIAFSQPCSTQQKVDFAGYEVGHDIGVLNANNWDWHFGVLAGYLGVNVSSPPGTGPLPSENPETNIPFAGFYTSFSRGAFSADLQARMYDLQGQSLGQRVDFRDYTLAANVAYRFDLPGNWTLEPSVGGTFARLSFGPINSGAVTFPLGPTSLATLGTSIQVQDVQSMLGRASVGLGTSLPVPGTQIVAYPFVTASVLHEFEGNLTGTLTGTGTFGPNQLQGGGVFTSPSIGTYGQFSGGSAFQLANTGWLGFLRVVYWTGENIQGYSVGGGLRYQFEEPGHEKRGPYPVKASMKGGPAESYDWSGPYAGLSVGSTWGHTHWATQGGTVDPDFAGYLLGGQVGYNFQKGKFVWGIEADAGASNARGEAACPIQPLLFGCNDNVGALGSLTARFGYTWGRALFYAKGGWAYGNVTAGRGVNFVQPGIPPPAGVGDVGQSTNWENGWTVGAGMEFALTDRWSAKAEYMHYEFPQYAFAVAPGVTANASTGGDIVRIGVNYHFRP